MVVNFGFRTLFQGKSSQLTSRWDGLQGAEFRTTVLSASFAPSRSALVSHANFPPDTTTMGCRLRLLSLWKTSDRVQWWFWHVSLLLWPGRLENGTEFGGFG